MVRDSGHGEHDTGKAVSKKTPTKNSRGNRAPLSVVLGYNHYNPLVQLCIKTACRSQTDRNFMSICHGRTPATNLQISPLKGGSVHPDRLWKPQVSAIVWHSLPLIGHKFVTRILVSCRGRKENSARFWERGCASAAV